VFQSRGRLAMIDMAGRRRGACRLPLVPRPGDAHPAPVKSAPPWVTPPRPPGPPPRQQLAYSGGWQAARGARSGASAPGKGMGRGAPTVAGRAGRGRRLRAAPAAGAGARAASLPLWRRRRPRCDSRLGAATRRRRSWLGPSHRRARRGAPKDRTAVRGGARIATVFFQKHGRGVARRGVRGGAAARGPVQCLSTARRR
jgi:hypothetical protein